MSCIDIRDGDKDDNRSKCNCTAVYRTGLLDFDRVDRIQAKTKKDAVLTCILVLCGIFCFFLNRSAQVEWREISLQLCRE